MISCAQVYPINGRIEIGVLSKGNGNYSDTLSKVLSGIVDAKVGDDYSSSVTTSKSTSGKKDQET